MFRVAAPLPIALTAALLAADASAAPGWSTSGNLVGGRTSHTATLLQSGKVLIAGGYDGGSWLASGCLYDPTSGTSVATGSLIGRRAGATAVLLPSGKVLVAGGYDGSNYLASAELYDPATGNWSATGSLLGPQGAHTLTLLKNGKVLAAGGSSGAALLLSAEVYDPATGTWTATAGNAASQHTEGAAALLPDGRVLLAGGWNGVNGIAAADVFDPATGLWSSTGGMRSGRTRHTATLLPDGRVLVAGGFGTVHLSSSELYDPASGTWSFTAGSLAAPRMQHTASLLPDGRLLVAGGFNSGTSYLASAELFDPTSGLWSSAGSLSRGRYGHTATILPSGSILVAGGLSATGYEATTERYDPASGSWALTGSMAFVRAVHTATLLRNGKVLVVGGVLARSSAELYDPGSGTWTRTGDLTTPRYWHTATLLLNGKVLIAGGYNGGSPFTSAELYDPETGTWTPTGSLNTGRVNHTATLLEDGRVLVAGGEDFSNNHDSAEIYDPATGQWALTGKLLVRRREHSATLLTSGKVLITGGCCDFGSGFFEFRSSEVYDPALGTWAATPGSMNVRRRFHTASLLPSGQVLVAAGLGSDVFSSAELFDPATGSWTLTGSLNQERDTHTATLLPNGKVLVVAGFNGTSYFRSAELYDPARGTWTSTADINDYTRERHTATLLPDGKVLVAGGYLSSAELYDVGLGYGEPARPLLDVATDPLVQGTALTATGSRFQGISQASGGWESQASPTNYPLVQLRRVGNEAVRWLPLDPAHGWSDTSFTSTALAGLQPGLALATVFTNGIPSVSRVISVECTAASLSGQPTPRALCAGGTIALSVTASGTSLGYQWRKDGLPLLDGGRLSGARTATLTISTALPSDSGTYDVVVTSACSTTAVPSSPAAVTVAPTLGAVTIASAGSTVVCPTCSGGIMTLAESGGGTVTHQWGFRTTSGGAITALPGETGTAYAIEGADFPGPGLYYLVETTTAPCGGTRISNETPVIVFTVAAGGEVPFFTVTSKDGENRLEWLNPTAGTYAATVVRYNKAQTGLSACAAPASPGDGVELAIKAGKAGAPDSFLHAGLENDTAYCYSAFVHKGLGAFSAGRVIKARPFDTSGPVKWAYSVGFTSMAPPGVGASAVHAVANDNALHSVVKGAGGGTWPLSWSPRAMSGPSQGRPNTISVRVGTADRVVFLGSQDGHLYAINADTGELAWPAPPLLGTMVQAAPSGMFRAFGGAHDYILVGTRNPLADNVFYALNLGDGSLAWSFDGNVDVGRIGIITGQASVDYARRRVYFTSYKGLATQDVNTVWCVNLDTGGVVWAKAYGDVATSPTLHDDRLYVGTNGGEVLALEVSTGDEIWRLGTGDGDVKGFVMSDRLGTDFYFSTTHTVQAYRDDGPRTTRRWSRSGTTAILTPSTPVFWVGGQHVYVGSGDGSLHVLNTLDGSDALLLPLGDQQGVVGSPTIDTREGYLYVGTDAGIVYAIQAP